MKAKQLEQLGKDDIRQEEIGSHEETHDYHGVGRSADALGLGPIHSVNNLKFEVLHLLFQCCDQVKPPVWVTLK